MLVRADGSAVGPTGETLREATPDEAATARAADASANSDSGSGSDEDDFDSICDSDDDGDDERRDETEFDHNCLHCGHLIASHLHVRIVSRSDRIDMMECVLCGRGHWKRQPIEL